MAARACLFFTVSLFWTPLQPDFAPRAIVWNVGQGLWVTIIDEIGCWHFDAGGERAPWSEVKRECRTRPNFISLSHRDWDHVSFYQALPRALPDICRHWVPSEAKFKTLPACARPPPFSHWQDARAKTSNGRSLVALFKGVLLPGDSTAGEERRWSRQMTGLHEARILIAGHHGSRTSTSTQLLAALPQLRMAVASARKRRYGHPHPKVQRTLREQSVPLLSTEDWGHIHIWL